MRALWIRGVVGLLLAELVPIVVLVLGVALFGPKEQTAANAYANQLGRWVGPIAGALCVLGFGRWVAQATTRHRLRAGFVFGCLAAALDLALLAATGAPFELLFAVSNVGRVLAGATGGLLATRAVPTT